MRAATGRPARTRGEQRRSEVVARLAALGLGPGRRLRLLGGELDRARRLRQALADLGRLFGPFGLYLATRPDLLAAADCLELSTLPDRAAASPFHAIDVLLERQLGRRASVLFTDISPHPAASRWGHQGHAARLASGERVTVEVVHPELLDAGDAPAWRADLEELAWLAEELTAGAWGDLPWALVVADFTATLERRLDLGADAAALAAMGAMAAKDSDGGNFLVPAVHSELSRPRVLITSAVPEAVPLAAWIDAAGAAGRGELARRIAGAWLRQALLGTAFPLEPTATDLAVCRGGRLAFTGGPCAGLPPRSQARLWDYLVATAAERPDRACELLLADLIPGRAARGADFLRARLRQAVTFRDGSFRDGGRDNTLAERLLLHLRLARASGYRLSSPLGGFARGLATVAVLCRRLAPDGDPFAEGWEELRGRTALGELWNSLQPHALAQLAGRQAGLLVAMPLRLDEALARVSAGAPPRRRRNGRRGGARRRGRLGSALGVPQAAALALTAAAFGVLVAALRGGTLPSPWGERAAALAWLLLGALALGATGRG